MVEADEIARFHDRCSDLMRALLDALAETPDVPRPFEMRGRPLEGWLRVDPEGLKTKRQLEPWVERGVAYARSLPPKP